MIDSLRRFVPGFIRRSYVLKFGITLLVLGAVIGAIGLFATTQIGEQVRDGVNQDLSNVAAQEANSFNSWHERNVLSARTIANSVQGVSPENMDLTSPLNQPGIAPNATSIHVVDLGERTVVASTQDYTGRNFQQRKTGGWEEFIRRVQPGDLDQTRVIGYYQDMTFGRLIVYAAPIAGSDRALVYLVNLDDYNAGLEREEGTVTYVIDAREGKANRVLLDSSNEAFRQKYPYSDVVAAIQRLKDGTHGDTPRVAEARQPSQGPLKVSAPSGFTKAEFIPSYASVSGTPFGVVVHTPKSQALGFVQTVEQYGYIATLAGVLVVGLVGAVLGRNTATSIDRLKRKSEEMERGNLDVEFDTDRIDNIGRLYEGMASMRDALRNQIMEAREAREAAELARQEAEQTSRHLQSKATDYRDVMQAVAAGDLSRRMDPSSRNQAMGEIAEEFNSMIDEIERTVTQLKEFANQVATSSEEVTASAEEVRSASQEVTESIQEISEGADRQDDQLQSVSSEMSDLSTTVEEIASLSNEVATISEQTADTGRRGREAAQEAIAGMNQIETESERAVEKIEQLDAEMSEIDELIEFIRDVADQTNMLALNANIEASRAGESGDGEGFGVVANEVKDLAAETKEAAEDIEGRIERIQNRTTETVDSVKATSENIEQNTQSVRNAVEALDEIAEYAEETNTGVQEISAATQQQAASTQQVVAMVDEAATISERTSHEAENVAAAAQEQTSAMSEVSESASNLSRQAGRLSEALDRFQTDEDEDDDQLVDLQEQDGHGNGEGDGDAFESLDTEKSDGDGLGGTDPATFGDIDDDGS